MQDSPVDLVITLAPTMYQPDVAWRMDEYVRVLNAHAILNAASGRYQHQESFRLDKPGPKFTRVIAVRAGNDSSVHCFIENASGKVIKSAGWKAPAKDKDGMAYRWDLMDDADRALLYAQTDKYGSIFYAGVPERLRRERDEAAQA